MAKLKVFHTVKEAYGFAFHNFFKILKTLWFLITLVTLGKVADALFTPPPGAEAPLSASMIIIMIVTALLSTWANTNITIYLYRMVILKDFTTSGFFGLRWGRLEWRVTLVMLKIMGVMLALVGGIALLIYLIKMVSQGASIVVGIIGGAFSLYALFKITLASVAAAIGEDDSLKTSWRNTKGNFWRIVSSTIVWILPYILLFVSMVLLTGFGAGIFSFLFMQGGAMMAIIVVLILVQTFITASGAGLIGSIYKQLAMTPGPIVDEAPTETPTEA